MLTTLAVANYRSLRSLVMPMGSLNLVTGANGSGKSSIYRALRLLAETAQGGVVGALSREGGLGSTLWAGPEKFTRGMLAGTEAVEGSHRRDNAVALKLGFSSDEFGYAIDLGYPVPSLSMFDFDPAIKSEVIFNGTFLRESSKLVERKGAAVRSRDGKRWRVVAQHMAPFESIFTEMADPERAPEVLALRETIRGWRFYDHFRSDADAPARLPQLATRTPVLSHDGRDLAAAWQTIREIGDTRGLDAAVDDAFPGARVSVVGEGDRLSLRFHQPGLLRPLASAELSDGTLRYLLWIAALHTPRPPPLMVLNEPETSLHPDLLPALGRLILGASKRSQVWVVSHASRLIATLEGAEACNSVRLEKTLSQTKIEGQGMLDEPPWHWLEDR
ncbi:MAG TPA: AAA family ATPase [Luteibacter sp.]|jgi:predicted ATPase|uniref:AAA family ATPase n=1 Tax=Luteibacter sp. TaxID=1886636 RepID=UPI002F42A2B2